MSKEELNKLMKDFFAHGGVVKKVKGYTREQIAAFEKIDRTKRGFKL